MCQTNIKVFRLDNKTNETVSIIHWANTDGRARIHNAAKTSSGGSNVVVVIWRDTELIRVGFGAGFGMISWDMEHDDQDDLMIDYVLDGNDTAVA